MSGKPRITTKQLREMLKRECRAAGSRAAWADLHGISAAYLSDVLTGRREPGDAICRGLGLQRVTLYEAREK